MAKKVDYTQKVLEVKNLKKYFRLGTGKNAITVRAVDDVTFDVYKREVFGLVGESGCGKTTTGRTIMKLYKATDGNVYLNDGLVTAGFRRNLKEIKRIKAEAKKSIVSFDPYKSQILAIKNEKHTSVNDLNFEINRLKETERAQIKELSTPIDNYNTKVYDAKNMHLQNVETIKYHFELAKADLIKKTVNSMQKEYENRLSIEKNTYKKKVEGLKDSAALHKSEIEKRIAQLEIQHKDNVSALETQYKPLIEQKEAEKLSKQVVKPMIVELKNKLKADLANEKARLQAELTAFEKPNTEAIKAQIAKVKAETLLKIAEKKALIKKVKLSSNEKMKAVPKSTSTKKSPEYKASVAKIKTERKALINAQKAEINAIKTQNKSKEATANARKMQMIFQDPIASLNPRMTVKEIVGEGLIIEGLLPQEEIDKKVEEALVLVGLSPDYMTRYPHEFSGGQRQRIGIARALIMNPNFIIADEPISALDVSIRAQVINLLTELKEDLGLTILFIAHDLSVVRFFCDRIAVMYFGKIVELATSEELFKNPMHPYTISLLSAIPQPDPDYEKGRRRIKYDPSQHNYRKDKPSLRDLGNGHMVYANDAEFEVMKQKYSENTK